MSKVYVAPDGRERGVSYPWVHGEEWGYGDKISLRSEVWTHLSAVEAVVLKHHDGFSDVGVLLTSGNCLPVLEFHADVWRPSGAGVRKASLDEARAEAVSLAEAIRQAVDRWRSEKGG